MPQQKSLYHFEPAKGWINDPNGLCRYKGRYHAFFQYNPYSLHWDRMHWGHAVSDDLLHWEELPIALYPDQAYDNGLGCFSGSALVEGDTLYLMYTSVSEKYGQTQSLVVSDGKHFEKYAGNPVIRTNPLDPSNRDFRDPKVFRWGTEYRMVCGTGVDGLASILLYGSVDLIHWEYMGPIFQSRNYGPVAECPDLYPVDGRWILMFSRMEKVRTEQFILGDFDGNRFIPESFQQPEKGPNFYAPQTFYDDTASDGKTATNPADIAAGNSDDKTDGAGRRILIGWMPHYAPLPSDAVRNGAFTIPREVHVREGQICLDPIREAGPLLQPWHVSTAAGPAGTASGLANTAVGSSGNTADTTKKPSDRILSDGDIREIFHADGTCETYYESESRG